MGVELTKQATATRLLRQAVRSYFRHDDKLAVYLLASAAGRLLSDLLEKAGIDWLELALQRSFFYWARDFAGGQFSGPAEIVPWIEPIALKFADGEMESPNSLSLVGLDQKLRKSLLRSLNREFNFLKHADVDALASIAEDEINEFFAVAKACVFFQDLFPHIDLDEVYLFKYLSQRRQGVGFSADVEPYPSIFDAICDDQIETALLDYLESQA